MPTLSMLIAKHRVMKMRSFRTPKDVFHTTQPLEPDSQDSGHATGSPIDVRERAIDSPIFARSDVAEACVVDTGCQRTAVGANVLARIVNALPCGMKVRYEERQFQFKGVGGVTTTRRVAVIPICLGRRPAIIRAAILEEPADAPLLFSLPILRALGAKIDIEGNRMHLHAIDERVGLQYNSRGQLCIRLFDFEAVRHDMNNMPWKPKKLIGDECTVFYQHAIPCTTSHVNKDINSHRNNAEGHQFNITNHQNTVTKSPAGSDRESSRCQIVDVSCEVMPKRVPSSDHCSTPDCSSSPHSSIRTLASDATVQHGHRSLSQEELSQPRDSRVRCQSASLETNGVQNADPRTLDHDVECDDRTLHASDSPLESDVDEDSTNRGDRVTGRDVRSCSSGNRREEGKDSSTGHASQKGEDGTKEQAEKLDPRHFKSFNRDDSEFPADSRQPKGCPTSCRTSEPDQSDISASRTKATSQPAHFHGGGRAGLEPTVLLWAPGGELHLQAEGSELWKTIPSMSTDSRIPCPVSLLHMDRATEESAVRSNVPLSDQSKQAWSGIWTPIGQESQIQSKAQEKDIKEALLQQLQQRCRDSRSPRSCRFQHKPWAFLSACVEPPRNKSTPRTEDMQAMWSSTGPCVQDRRDHTLQSGSQQDQVSAQNSHPRVQSMPRGIRKRIIGELKKQIHHLEQQKSETKMSNQEDPKKAEINNVELKELFHLMTIGEIYSPPRCTARAHRHGLVGGRAFDLTLGDDLLDPENRKACLKHLREHDYDFLAVTPPCTMFSMLQFLGANRSREELEHDPVYQRKFHDAMILLTFGVICCLDQQRRGRWYMFEQPWNACSWRQPIVQRVLRLPSTYVGRTDQCCFGLVDANHAPIRKRTGIMSNSRCLIREVVRTCKGNHAHQHCVGTAQGQMRSTAAAKYTTQLVDAILRGITKEMRNQSPRSSHDIEEYRIHMYQLQEVSSEQCSLNPEVFLITSPDETDTVPQVHQCHLDVDASQFDAFPNEAQPESAESGEHLAPVDEELEEIHEDRKQRILNEIRAIHQGLGHPVLESLDKNTAYWQGIKGSLSDCSTVPMSDL